MNALLKKSLAEFVGVTGFLTAITAANADFKTFSLALTLGIMIILTGPISGGHLNPVVSLYFYIKREITLGNLLAFVGAQLAGGIAGANLGALISGKTLVGFKGIADNLPFGYLAGEVVATAGLVWLIATLVNNKQGNVIPFAVAAWVFAAANFTPTGAQANPAVTFGLMVQGLASNQGVSLMVAEVFGLLLAIILLIVLAPKAKKVARKK
jgi:glycerol uptake facilitator-like aquaporin